MLHSFFSVKPKKDAGIKDNTSEAISQNDNVNNEINTSTYYVNDNVLNVDMKVQHFICLFILNTKHHNPTAMKVIMA